MSSSSWSDLTIFSLTWLWLTKLNQSSKNISSVLVHNKELTAIWKLLLLSGMLKNDAISKRLIYVWKNGENKNTFFLSKIKRIMFLQIEKLLFFLAVFSSSFLFCYYSIWDVNKQKLWTQQIKSKVKPAKFLNCRKCLAVYLAYSLQQCHWSQFQSLRYV